MNSIGKRVERLEAALAVEAILPIRWWHEGQPCPTGPGMVVRWMFDGEEETVERGNH
jgi:hypothetical protein